MKGYFSAIVITVALFVLPAAAQEEKSPQTQPVKDKLEILNKGSEPRCLFKKKVATPGKYIDTKEVKIHIKDIEESESSYTNESSIISEVSISKPDKKGVQEIVSKLQSMKSKSNLSDDVFSMTRAEAMKELKSDKNTASQPTSNKARQGNKAFSMRLLASTKVMKIGPDGEIISVTIFEGDSDNVADVKGMNQYESNKSEKAAYYSDIPDVPVGVGAEWIVRQQGEVKQFGKYEAVGKYKFESIKESDYGKIAVIKSTWETPKLQVKIESNMSSMKQTTNATSMINLEKGFVQKAIITRSTECEYTADMSKAVNNETIIETITPVVEKD